LNMRLSLTVLLLLRWKGVWDNMKKTELIVNPATDLVIKTKDNEVKTALIFFDEKIKTKHVRLTMRPSKNSKLYVIVACALKGTSHLTLETHQMHDLEHGWSDFLCKSVLHDKSTFNYHGHINIGKEGQHAHAYQRNENLVLSDDTHVVSEPNLEILANDVFCTHGATTGYLNDVEMHYLESRGLPRAKAEALYTKGFLLSITDKLIQAGVETDEIEELKSKLEEHIN
jgi:Fe-S cluster assembly scaffold protein SufB